jgi:hypothetical protein
MDDELITMAISRKELELIIDALVLLDPIEDDACELLADLIYHMRRIQNKKALQTT